MGLSLWGAGGGGTKRTHKRTGGDGGYAYGEYTFVPSKTYYIVVGGAGIGGNEKCNSPTKYSCADTGCGLCENPSGGNHDGAAGGGYTGVFEGDVSIRNAIIVAGGGGGATGDIAYGGHGGGESGNKASNYQSGRGGEGGQHNRGGAGNRGGKRGEPLKGGRSHDHGGGGGGGYYGGGGGGNVGPGGGGGGSSFVSQVENGVTRAGGGTSRKHYRSGVGRGGASGGRGGGGLLVMVRVK